MLFLLISTLPVILCMDPVTLDLLTPATQFGEGCGYDSCKPTRENTLNVHIVPHTHAELGFTADFYVHYTGDLGDNMPKSQVNMKRILDYTISELWADSERKFTLSDMAYFFYWWSQRDGTVHRMVYELIRQGRLHFVGGGFSMPDEATTNYHSVIDMFTYSLRKLNSSFLDCARPLVSWQADVFGHSKEFASLMAQMGFEAHYINPISYDDEVSRMINKSLEFLWRGSDELGSHSDIFTHKLFDGYWSPPGFCFGSFCEDPLLVDSDSVFKNIEKRVEAFIESASHRQGPYYTTRNIMVVMGQRFGYFDAGVWFANIDKLINNVNVKSASTGFPVYLFYSAPACYLKSVMETNPDLSTKQDDFFPFAYDQSSMAVGFYTSRPTFKFLARLGHVYMQIAKQLQISARLLKGYDSIMERFMWTNSVMQDHNIITGVMVEHVKQYYTHKMYLAIQASTKLTNKAVNILRKSPLDTKYYRCMFNISLCQNTDAQQYFIVIYNPLAWNVTVNVRLPTINQPYIVYHPTGMRVKASMMRIADPVLQVYRHRTYAKHELVFIAEDVPAMGFRSYFVRVKTFGWKRDKRSIKRSILKKVNKHKTKKYLVRQAFQNPLSDDKEDMGFDYEYFEGSTTPKTKILFSSVETEKFSEQMNDYDNVITPRARPEDTQSFRKANVLKNITNLRTEPTFDDIRPTKSADADIEVPTKLRKFDLYNDTKFGKKYTNETKVNDKDDSNKITDENKFSNKNTNENKSSKEVSAESKETLSNSDIELSAGQFNDSDFVETTTAKAKQENKTAKLSKDNDINKSNENEVELKARPIKEDVQARKSSRIKDKDVFDKNEKVETTTKIVKDDGAPSDSKSRDLGIKSESDKEVKINETRKFDQLFKSDDEAPGKPLVSEGGSDSEKDNPEIVWDGFDYFATDDLFIRNRYVRVNLDEDRRLSGISLSNGVNISFSAQMFFYASDDPAKFDRDDRQPGITMFRAMDPRPEPIKDFYRAGVYKNRMVQEVHIQFSYFASFVIRLYRRDPVIELEWLVGPIPIEDDIGKDIFIRYTTNLVNNGEFFTDSNGRQTIKRIRNKRPTYEPMTPDYLAGNIYPVNSKIYIEDQDMNIRFAIFNDRAQGATSLNDGEVDVFLHRRILTDDTNRGFMVLNETEHGEQGIRVRGKHFLYLTKADSKPNRIFEKKLAKEKEMPPQILVTRAGPYGLNSRNIWMKHVNEYTALKTKLPIGVHVLSFEKWGEKGEDLLLRLENYLEKSDTIKSGIKMVNISSLFVHIRVISVVETSLGGNLWMNERKKWNWRHKQKFVKNFNNAYGNEEKKEFAEEDERTGEDTDLANAITLVPQQIRTFFVKYEYVGT